jgi:hypothetical protein
MEYPWAPEPVMREAGSRGSLALALVLSGDHVTSTQALRTICRAFSMIDRKK